MKKTKKTILLMMILSMLLTVCFPASASDARAEEASEREIPASFDLRNVDTDGDGIGDRCYVTPVKFQNPFNTCWAFAAISAAETSLLGSVYADDPDAWRTLDLSEKHLAYFSHVPLNDPSSPQNGEGTGAIDPTKMMDVYGGGTTAMAAMAFAQGVGPADEHPASQDVGETLEYHGKEYVTTRDYFDGAYRNFTYSDEDDWTIPEELRFHQDYVLTEAHFLTSPARLDGFEHYEYDESATTAIKRQLLEKHGVMFSMLADASTPSSMDAGEAKYISDKWAHYTWDFGSSIHSVAVIGWDDHYPRENFLAAHQPPADGAWLCKNSWGSAEREFPSYGQGNWGIEDEDGRHTGYFWISYYDHSISEPVALELKAALAPQYTDQHDYFLPDSLRFKNVNQTATMANVFKADHSRKLRFISCMTPAANTSVSYRIYLLQDQYQSPEDGLMAAEGTAGFADAGFHRIPVDEILVQKDQYFSIVMTLTRPDGTCDVIMNRTYGFAGDDVQNAIVNERESYLYQDGQWQDYSQIVEARLKEAEETGESEFVNTAYDNFPIKAYSDRVANDAKLKLSHGEKPLCLLEDLDTDLYKLRFTVRGAFDIVNPSIAWQVLPGSEGIVELKPEEEGSKLSVTAKAPGKAMLSVTVEGVGTTVFPVEVLQGRLGMVTVVALDPAYTGQEIIPMVMVSSDVGPILTEDVHYQVTYTDNIRCGLARAEITGIGTCADPESEPFVDYFAIVPQTPDIRSLSAEKGEIRLSVSELSDGADGCEVQYRLKGKEAWEAASFGAAQRDLVIEGLAAGEYEVQVCAFVDNTDASAPEHFRTVERGKYGDIFAVTVP